MQATVDRSRCQGYALCNVPELFALDDEDSHAYVLSDPVPDTLAGLARSAAGSCPSGPFPSLADFPAFPILIPIRKRRAHGSAHDRRNLRPARLLRGAHELRCARRHPPAHHFPRRLTLPLGAVCLKSHGGTCDA